MSSPPFSNVVGVAEIAVRAGVKPDTVVKWRQRGIGFPEPWGELAACTVWWWPDIEAWLNQPRPPGRPTT